MNNETASDSQEADASSAEALVGTVEKKETLRLTAVVSGLVDAARGKDLNNKGEARRLVIDWLASRLRVGNLSPETAFSRYAYELWRVRSEALPQLVKTFIPEDIQQEKRFIGGLERGRDRQLSPITLLQRAVLTNGGRAGEIRRFEATRDLALGYYFLWLVTEAEYQGTMDRRYWDQAQKSSGDRNRFQAWLQREGVISGQNAKQRIFTAHEPHENRCLGILFGNDKRVFVAPPASSIIGRHIPDQYVVQLACPGGEIPAIYVVRRKGVVQTIAKMLLLGIANPRNVPDRRGIRFAYRNVEELRVGSEFISSKIGLALARKERINSADPEINPHAAPNLTVIKDSATYLDREIEIQNLLAVQHVDLMRSHGPEYSLRYHRRQYTDPHGIFPQVFPHEYCGTDWRDKDFLDRMDAHIIASIPK